MNRQASACRGKCSKMPGFGPTDAKMTLCALAGRGWTEGVLFFPGPQPRGTAIVVDQTLQAKHGFMLHQHYQLNGVSDYGDYGPV